MYPCGLLVLLPFCTACYPHGMRARGHMKLYGPAAWRSDPFPVCACLCAWQVAARLRDGDLLRRVTDAVSANSPAGLAIAQIKERFLGAAGGGPGR